MSTWVEASPHLLRSHPAARVRARIAALGLRDSIVLTGPRDDIPSIMAAADAVALPSVWEGLPLAILEAMASARPLVAIVWAALRVFRDGIDSHWYPRVIRLRWRAPYAICAARRLQRLVTMASTSSGRT